MSFCHKKKMLLILDSCRTVSVPCHREKSISVFCRIILWRHHQTSSFSRPPVHRFNNVYHLLLVLHRPVDLIVVTGAQINHDVFVPENRGMENMRFWHLNGTLATAWEVCSTWKRTWRCRGRTAHTSCWSLALLWCPPGKWQRNFLPVKHRRDGNVWEEFCSANAVKERADRTFSAMLYRTSSIFMHVGSQSWPKRITMTRSSSDRMAWSTCQPLWRCGSMYDMTTNYKAKTQNL